MSDRKNIVGAVPRRYNRRSSDQHYKTRSATINNAIKTANVLDPI